MFGWDDALAGIMQIANKCIADPAERDKFQIEMAQMKAQQEAAQLAADTQLATAQTDIDKVEASSDDNFTRRWRPFIGWICGVAFAYHFILQPFLIFVFAIFGRTIATPSFDMNTLYTVLMGLLGLGTMRTIEKIRK